MIKGVQFDTEAVILLRQGGTTMAVHLPNILLTLAPIIHEPEYYPPDGLLYNGPSITGYEAEASGVADRITVWQGADPFAKPELDSPRQEVQA